VKNQKIFVVIEKIQDAFLMRPESLESGCQSNWENVEYQPTPAGSFALEKER
jgi:hypothetical protein